jgi:putative aminopeptidase FrvX
MIDSGRLSALLLDLVRISSPSRTEHAVAARLREELEWCG